MNPKQSAAEAVLFAAGEPLACKRLAAALALSEEETQSILDELMADYERNPRGICLLKLENRYQLCSRQEYADAIRRIQETAAAPSLSKAALEVLTIAAYRQPVTRAYIDQLRGVDSAYTVSGLVEKGFLQQTGHLDVPGHPALFCTTDRFLRTFCLQSLSELPELPEFERPEGGETP